MNLLPNNPRFEAFLFLVFCGGLSLRRFAGFDFFSAL